MIPLGVIALVLCILALLYRLVMEDRLSSKLRARHPDVWNDLGSPNRYFDDGGVMTHAALDKLSRKPELLRRCDDDIVREIRLTRKYGTVRLAIALAVLMGLLAYSLTQL
jgi:hypothetical protein